MHVVQLGPYPPPEGGISRNMLAIRDELRSKGALCSIIATAKSSRVTDEADVYYPRSPFELIKLLGKLKFDILHVHVGGDVTPRILAFLLVCAIFGRGKSVLTLHSGGYALENAETAKKTSLAGFIFRRFKRVIGVNPLMLKMFENFGIRRENLRIILPFVLKTPEKDVEIPSALDEFSKKHRPFLLAMCLLEDTYDLFMQIDALGKVLEKLPDAGLLIAGSGSLENELRKTIGEKSYSEHVFLAGDVAHPVALHLIDRADILLRTTKFDGDAIAVREALFLETPVIATDNGMRPDGVHLIPIHDETALVEKIVELAQIERASKSPKSSDNTNIKAVLKVYEEVIGQSEQWTVDSGQ